MHPIIRDKATPKTGGVKNRAHPTPALRFKPGMPKSEFRIDAICPNAQNKPNPGTAGVSPAFPAKFAKRTQFTPRPRSKMQNQPNLPRCPTTQKYETNPIYPAATVPPTRKCETNPIPATADLWRTKKTKRTQLTPPRVIPSVGLRSEAQRSEVENYNNMFYPNKKSITYEGSAQTPSRSDSISIENRK